MYVITSSSLIQENWYHLSDRCFYNNNIIQESNIISILFSKIIVMEWLICDLVLRIHTQLAYSTYWRVTALNIHLKIKHLFLKFLLFPNKITSGLYACIVVLRKFSINLKFWLQANTRIFCLIFSFTSSSYLRHHVDQCNQSFRSIYYFKIVDRRISWKTPSRVFGSQCLQYPDGFWYIFWNKLEFHSAHV